MSERIGTIKPHYNTALRPWLVCFSASLLFFFIFIQLNMPNSLGPELVRHLHIDAAILASIVDKYFLANVIFLFPAGMLLDRFSARKLMLGAMALAVVCTGLFAVVSSIGVLKVLRFLTGVAGTFCLLGAVRIASRWFLPRKMALVVGLIVTFAMIGGMVAQTPLAVLSDHVNYRYTLMLDACFGVLLFIIMFVFVRDFPPGQSTEQPLGLKGRTFWRALGATVSRKQNWFAGLYTSLMNLPVFLFGAMWGVFYLMQVWGLAKNTATVVTSLLFVGLVVGSPFVGWLSDRMQRRKLPMILGAMFSFLLVLILMFDRHLTVWSLGLLFFAMGFVSSAQIISYPLIAESNPLSMTATAEGFASALIMGGGYVQALFAILIQLQWNHAYSAGQPIYSSANYLLGLLILPIAYIVSFILACLVRESYCKPYEGVDTHSLSKARSK